MVRDQCYEVIGVVLWEIRFILNGVMKVQISGNLIGPYGMSQLEQFWFPFDADTKYIVCVRY